jgi:ubiquinone biosynthesis protein
MVLAAMTIIEPLPPIDKVAFGHRLEAMFWNDLYAIKSKHSHWAERISSRMWIGFLNLSREFQIPMRLNTLRMIRASLLTDTIAARLDHDQDTYREFRHYEKGAGRRAKKRILKRLHRLAGPSKFIRIEQGIESGINFFFQLQKPIDSLASIRIGAIVATLAYFFSLLLQELTWASASAAAFTLGIWGVHWIRQILWKYPGIKLSEVLHSVLRSHAWQITAAAPVLLILWRISFRLGDKKLPRGSSARDDI